MKSAALSVLLHGLLLIILVFINARYTTGPAPEYTTINFTQVIPPKPSTKRKPEEKPQSKKEKIKLPEKPHEEIQKDEENKITTEIDTTPIQQVYEAPQVTFRDTVSPNLKYAKTLLDTFLVLHPEYSKYILEEQARDFIRDGKNKVNTRLAMERKINDMLHKYIRQQYLGNAGNAALDKYPGPGVGAHVPLDGLIDAVKKLFEGNMPPDTSGVTK
jgi:hypothetical protein